MCSDSNIASNASLTTGDVTTDQSGQETPGRMMKLGRAVAFADDGRDALLAVIV
jgi:hypothetical protein